jgi:hypothetical protein
MKTILNSGLVRVLAGLFVIAHGLVHLWFVVLSREWVPFEPEMGWTGESWLLTGVLGDAATRSLASVLYALVALVFVIGGIGILVGGLWARPILIGVASLSAAMIVIFWDGQPGMIVEKGLLGFLISVGVLVVTL